MEPLAELTQQVEVRAHVPLAVEAGFEGGRAERPERRVHAVEKQEVDLVPAGADAHVPAGPGGGETANAEYERRIHAVAAEHGLEAAREEFLEAEAVRIVEDASQRVLVRKRVRHRGRPGSRPSRPAFRRPRPGRRRSAASRRRRRCRPRPGCSGCGRRSSSPSRCGPRGSPSRRTAWRRRFPAAGRS